jgi:hypothetical protein
LAPSCGAQRAGSATLGQERFGEWQAQQETEGVMAHGDDVIHDSEQLAWDTDWLLNRGW